MGALAAGNRANHVHLVKRFGPFDCPACHGVVECHGGGNLRCSQRDPLPSHIAGILDSYGGTRVVVARKAEFKHHVRCGEFLCIVPRKLVHTPINWSDKDYVITLGELAVEKWVKLHEHDNDSDVREAVTHYRLRRTWQTQRSLDLEAIAYT